MFKYLLLASCLLSSIQALAQTSIWKVSKGDHSIFIGGTIHLLRESDYPLPQEFLAAYQLSDELKFETDIQALQEPAASLKLLQMMTLPGTTTLKDKLSKKTWNQLSNYAAQNQLDIKQWMKFEPAFVSMILSVYQMQKLGFQQEQGVEVYFSKQAKQDNKKINYLESIDEQMKFMRSMTEGEANQIIANTLQEINKTPDMLEQMTHAWRTGNMHQLKQLGIDPIKKESKEMYDILLIQRNMNWIPSIEKDFNSKRKVFVLVGCLHLAGQHNVLKLLENKGYTVQQFILNPADKNKNTPPTNTSELKKAS